MLSESFVASSSNTPKDSSATSIQLKDAGVFEHSWQPHPSLRATFKKSATQQNCLAVSSSHIFAAQAGKAIIHVYSREKGNQEAIVSFNERITSITLAENNTVLVIGTEDGRLILWELYTGRRVYSSASHLQAVNCLAVDLRSNFVLSGSADASVLVWSLLDLLSFRALQQTGDGHIAPRLTFSGHRSGVTALATGHSGSFLDVAVSASKDKTVIIWSYYTGEQYRTFLTSETPLCMVIDPADRAVYLGCEGGAIQLLDLLSAHASGRTIALVDSSQSATAIQPPARSLWQSHLQDIGLALCVSLSYDGTMLLSGHESGKILLWDIAAGRFASVVAEYSGAPITNITFTSPTGFPDPRTAGLKISTVVKTRLIESSPANGDLPGNYAINAQLVEVVYPADQQPPETGFNADHNGEDADLEAALIVEGGHEILNGAILSTSSSGTKPRDIAAEDLSQGAHFVPLESASDTGRQNNEVQALQEQILHLKNVQETSFKQIADLEKDRRALRTEADSLSNQLLDRAKRRRAQAEARWATQDATKAVEQSDSAESSLEEASDA